MLLLAALAFASCTNAQKMKEADVPAPVKASFAKEHPNTKVKWEKEKGYYEAGWEDKNGEGSVLYDASGKALEHEMEIAVKDLPKSISDYIAKNYKGEKISEASKIVDDKGVMTYEAEVKKIDLIFDANGKFIKESKD